MQHKASYKRRREAARWQGAVAARRMMQRRIVVPAPEPEPEAPPEAAPKRRRVEPRPEAPPEAAETSEPQQSSSIADTTWTDIPRCPSRVVLQQLLSAGFPAFLFPPMMAPPAFAGEVCRGGSPVAFDAAVAPPPKNAPAKAPAKAPPAKAPAKAPAKKPAKAPPAKAPPCSAALAPFRRLSAKATAPSGHVSRHHRGKATSGNGPLDEQRRL